MICAVGIRSKLLADAATTLDSLTNGVVLLAMSEYRCGRLVFIYQDRGSSSNVGVCVSTGGREHNHFCFTTHSREGCLFQLVISPLEGLVLHTQVFADRLSAMIVQCHQM